MASTKEELGPIPEPKPTPDEPNASAPTPSSTMESPKPGSNPNDLEEKAAQEKSDPKEELLRILLAIAESSMKLGDISEDKLNTEKTQGPENTNNGQQIPAQMEAAADTLNTQLANFNSNSLDSMTPKPEPEGKKADLDKNIELDQVAKAPGVA